MLSGLRTPVRLSPPDCPPYSAPLSVLRLCIDEFPNVSEMDPFLVQQMFNTFSERGHSILLCMQCQPEKMEELFSITSIGQSIKGRILQKAKRLHLSGTDLRLTDVS